MSHMSQSAAMPAPPISPLVQSVLRQGARAQQRLEQRVGQLMPGQDAQFLAELVAARGDAGPLLYIAASHARMQFMREALEFFAPNLQPLCFPSWDCLPYEPRAPTRAVMGERMACLAAPAPKRRVILTTAPASLQKLAPRAHVRTQSFMLEPQRTQRTELLAFLALSGYQRAGMVQERGEYAVRGGLLDLFAAAHAPPLRLDFMGETLESMRPFALDSQRNQGEPLETSVHLFAAEEVALTPALRARFQRSWRRRFGVSGQASALWHAMADEAQSEPPQGLHGYMPLCFARLESLLAHLAPTQLVLDEDSAAAAGQEVERQRAAWRARASASEEDAASPPMLPPQMLFLSLAAWKAALAACPHLVLHRLAAPEPALDGGGRMGVRFHALPGDPFTRAARAIAQAQRAGQRVLVTAASEEGVARLASALRAANAPGQKVANAAAWQRLARGQHGLARMDLPHGFTSERMLVVSESDLVGHRRLAARTARRSLQTLPRLLAQMPPHSLAVHALHGIGRFVGLELLTVDGAPHDCLCLRYRNQAKLYVPVEHANLVAPYASQSESRDEGDDARLDLLGGVGWGKRKARVEKRLKAMAEELVKIAARRSLQTLPRFAAPEDGSYDAFCAAFPFEETPDQRAALDEIEAALAARVPMDRLVCGDAGFGKTELALRASFLVASQGAQVAILAPTSLLARQHWQNFRARFEPFPMRIGEMSRLAPAAARARTARDLASGQVDIVIGTHALLSERVRFRNLALLIVDEEQHFGVRHKERLKSLRGGRHVLALSATPIPRSLQMALMGLREFSLIRTAPPQRLEIATRIGPFDPLTIVQALERERARAGQSFFICPRIHDLERRAEFLRRRAPQLRVLMAHGQLPARQLEERMRAFYDGSYDVLLSTSIVESGLDIVRANTIVIDDAHKFGLGQLYQMRGRVGRGRRRAYAYVTWPAEQTVSEAARQRLAALSALQGPGAGFALASQDLELRGGGNLLGEEQAGHIREVGFTLYQQMLEAAVQRLKGEAEDDGEFAPQLQLGCPAFIAPAYMPALDLRLREYRRLAALTSDGGVGALAEEWAERFGPLPQPLTNLLAIVRLKFSCRAAGIASLQAGPKGLQLRFDPARVRAPRRLLAWVQRQPHVRLRPDESLVFALALPSAEDRLQHAEEVARTLAAISAEGEPETDASQKS